MKKILLFVIICLFGILSQAQPSTYININTPAPICNSGDCTPLVANFLQTYSTSANNYTVSNILYNPEIYAYQAAPISGIINAAADDQWTDVIPLPFSFCFYGNIYNYAMIGTNGILSFNVSPTIFPGGTTGGVHEPGDFCVFSFGPANLPQTGFNAKNAIFGVYQDIDIRTISNSGNIPDANVNVQNANYRVVGVRPNRKLIVNFNEIPNYNAPTPLQTSQIIIYETTNVVDVNVKRRTIGPSSWQKYGIIGLINQAGDKASIAPGRNGNDLNWVATTESWRFTPSSVGVSNVSVEWFDGTTSLGTGTSTGIGTNTINVCPTSTKNYRAVATYLLCDGSTEQIQDTEIFGPNAPLQVNDPEPKILCEPTAPTHNFNLNQSAVIFNTPPFNANPSNFAITYHLTKLDAELGLSAIATLNPYPSPGLGEQIWIRIEDFFTTNCINVRPFTLTSFTNPTGTFSYSSPNYCQDVTSVNSIPAGLTTGGTYSATPAGLSINANTGEINPSLSTVGITYDVVYNIPAVGTCSALSTPIVQVTINPLPATPTATPIQPTCASNTGGLTVTSPIGANFEYSIDGGLNYQSSIAFNSLAAATTYTVTVRNTLTGCVSLGASVIIDPAIVLPPAPTASASAQPNCNNPTGTIDITSPIGATLEYSIDGIAYQSSTTFLGLLPNTTYNVIVRDINTTCLSSATLVTINPIPANPVTPVANTTFQPNCTIPTGTITVTSPLGTTLEYSIDGGTNYQSGLIFANLIPNTSYNVIVRNTATGCVSLASAIILVNAIPSNPIQPIATPTQPTCTITTGSIQITSPIGANFEYSINGGTSYQSSTSFGLLTASTTYSIMVRDVNTGCISTAAIVPILPTLNVPIDPTASTTVQPTCASPTGTIVVTSPLGGTLQYSIDLGVTYQISPTFPGLAPNANYNITVLNTISTCASLPTIVTVNAIPGIPATPTASVSTQPNCNITTGTITITAPLGNTLEYSNNGGTSYQTGLIFTGLIPNTNYPITVRNTTTGCVSNIANVLVNAIPANPVAPVAIATVQPTCIIGTGTITVNSPVGNNFQYSINGGTTYQAGLVFSGLIANSNYTIIVKDIITGCISVASTSIIINAVPPIPATPIPTSADVCLNETINLNTPAVTGVIYKWTGPNGFTSSSQNPIISNASLAMSGEYSVIIYLTPDCPSLPGKVNVIVNPLPQPTPQNGFICVDFNNIPNTTYTIDSQLNNLLYDFIWSDINGVIIGETQSILLATQPGNYSVKATLKVAPFCESNLATVNVEKIYQLESIVAEATSEYFADNQTITVTVTPIGEYEYQLENGAYQSSNIFTNVSPGTKTIKARNICNFLETSVFIIDFPRFFTPNGDGFNDTWNISSLNAQSNSKINIFDRLGKLIKQIAPSGNGWNGTFNGIDLPATDYWFTIEYQEDNVNKEFKSHFSLKR